MYGQTEFGRLSKGRQRGAQNPNDQQKIKTRFHVSHSYFKPPAFQADNDSGAMPDLLILSIKMREVLVDAVALPQDHGPIEFTEETRMFSELSRRELFKRAAAAATALASTSFRELEARQAPTGNTSPFFPGFRTFKYQTSGAMINGVIGGQGPPLLLLHGAPLSHISWRLIAPDLAKTYTVVAPDLRGYGDSSKPADKPDHSPYSKREMALDHVEVMKSFGFNSFRLVGHDRGGRVSHRLTLDHPDSVIKLAVLDIVPTYYLYSHVNEGFINAYFHWFQNVRTAPIPEESIAAPFAGRTAPTDPAQAEYFRIQSNPANIHGMCEDYRASASIDLAHDKADLTKKVACPLHVMWAKPGAMDGLYDVLSIWKERGNKVTGKGMPGGHNMQEGAPAPVLAELQAFLK
jgi:haloacetate dehalogenase